MIRYLKGPAFLLLSLLGAACGDAQPSTPPGTARFAEATTDERESAVSIGVGMGAATAFSTVALTEIDARFQECPVRTVDGAAIVYDAGEGCTTQDGTRYAGRLTAVNTPVLTPDGFDYDPTKPSELVFDAFERGTVDAPFAIDGTVRLTGVSVGGKQRVETHLSMDLGSEIDIELIMDCDGAPEARRCEIATGSAAAIAGLGTFVARGELTKSPEGFDGWLELEGADRMRVEFQAGQACSPITIDGLEGGELCSQHPM